MDAAAAVVPENLICFAGLSRAIEGANLPNSGQLNSLEWMAPERLVGEVRNAALYIRQCYKPPCHGDREALQLLQGHSAVVYE